MNTLYLALAYLVPHCVSSPGSSTRIIDSIINHSALRFAYCCRAHFFSITLRDRVFSRLSAKMLPAKDEIKGTATEGVISASTGSSTKPRICYDISYSSSSDVLFGR
jgi:hypothetical protein